MDSIRGSSQTDFQQNKDWNELIAELEKFTTISQTDFQQNKDWNPFLLCCVSFPQWTPRPISNKTRIETTWALALRPPAVYSQTDFQQNKDWNFICQPANCRACYLPDRFPTKQGLKQQWIIKLNNAVPPPRPISNKTRIETRQLSELNKGIADSQTDFQQNKDWNNTISQTTALPNRLPDRFPTKQGLKQRFQLGFDCKKIRSQTDFQQNKDWNRQHY